MPAKLISRHTSCLNLHMHAPASIAAPSTQRMTSSILPSRKLRNECKIGFVRCRSQESRRVHTHALTESSQLPLQSVAPDFTVRFCKVFRKASANSKLLDESVLVFCKLIGKAMLHSKLNLSKSSSGGPVSSLYLHLQPRKDSLKIQQTQRSPGLSRTATCNKCLCTPRREQVPYR